MNARKIFALLIIGCGIIIFAGTMRRATSYSREKEMPVQRTGFSSISTSTVISLDIGLTSLPVRIRIPKIAVDAAVEEVGITFKGNMSTPKKLADTGWYKYGTLPGTLGSAVIDGHVDNGFGLPGVFADLKKLQVGDDVYVDTKDSAPLHFVVTEVQTYYYKDVPLDLLFLRKDGAYLNLITCDGNWIPYEKTDDHRVVVYTKLVSAESGE